MTIQTRSYPGTTRRTTQQPSTGSTDTTAPMTSSTGMAPVARALKVTDMDGRTWSLTMTAGRGWIHGRLGEAQASDKVCWRREPVTSFCSDMQQDNCVSRDETTQYMWRTPYDGVVLTGDSKCHADPTIILKQLRGP